MQGPPSNDNNGNTTYTSNMMYDSSDSEDFDDESKEEKHRRASIQAIMSDTLLTPFERRKSIQNMMDGRRRSSKVLSTRSSMVGVVENNNNEGENVARIGDAAAEVAKWFEDEDYNSNEEAEDHGSNSFCINGGCDSKCNSRHNSIGSRRRSSLYNVQEDEELGIEDGDREQQLMPPANANEEWYQCMRMERNRPECTHYERKCTIISPCCGQAFGCRICHDESPILPPPFFLRSGEQSNNNNHDEDDCSMDEEDTNTESSIAHSENVHSSFSDMKKNGKSHRSASLPTTFSKCLAITDDDEDFHHTIDRFAIKEIICRECHTRQSSKTNNCINCNIQFGEYHCSICNLWMSNEEKPYHCKECGFCRVGGSDNFKHCMDCGMCIDVDLFHDHNCKSGKYMSNCPVCQEDLFSSRDASHEMPCGHAIHWHCFEELTGFDSRCPICKKTAETPEQMAPTWQAMEISIAIQPVPLELTKVVSIACNDCEQEDTNRRWHFLGVQCNHCTSFNTNIDKILMVGQDAVAFLGPDDQRLERAREAFAAAMTVDDDDDDVDEYYQSEAQHQQQRYSSTTTTNNSYTHDMDDRNAAQYNLHQFLNTANNNNNNNNNNIGTLNNITATAYNNEDQNELSENED